ncbi:protein phosphatase [Lithospermum erythrorhizon]|uniref:protein-serine/threonine phosphatase n=1 Tax=Lithospermum erythrorhizon TaxID=34254 RepID=A0AAV3PNI1_LITER
MANNQEPQINFIPNHLHFMTNNFTSFSSTNITHFHQIFTIFINNINHTHHFLGFDINKYTIVIICIVMLVLFIILVIIACKFKPWRVFFASSSSTRPRIIKADDIERPLVSEDPSLIHSQSYDFSTENYTEDVVIKSQGGFASAGVHGLANKKKQPSILPQLKHSDSFILNIPDSSEDSYVGQTLKRPLLTSQLYDEQTYSRTEDINYGSRFDIDEQSSRRVVPKYNGDERSVLMLEVIAGPSKGIRSSIHSTNTHKLPLTLGRVLPNDVVLTDSEVSGKHAHINWNINKLKWELVDLGSLNGTLLNSKAIQHHQIGSRLWGDPVELSSGDIITLGTTSKIFVQITSQNEFLFPFVVGMASDPMALRRGGKKLPMEDICYYQWPLPGTDQFGLFGICDGHGGAGAATSVSKIMPEMIAKFLSDPYRKEQVLSTCNASDVLREAFYQTEACMDHYYEGCTATALLVWADGHDNFYAQCGNVGDSACFINIDGKQIKMTEDHRITSYSERLRIQATGRPLRDGETRLCGLNLARVLGDKFLKQQDDRISSEPYISEVVYINQASKAFAVIASDGFWDVITVKKASQLVEQITEVTPKDQENSAERIANVLLNEARTLRTKDNTSIVLLDFNSTNTSNSCKLDP